MRLSCLAVYRSLLTKNALIFWRYKLFLGLLLTVLFSGLFATIRFAFINQIVPKNIIHPVRRMPNSDSITKTYLSHLCYPIYDLLFKTNTEVLPQNLINLQISYLITKENEFKVNFENLAQNTSNEIDLIDICTSEEFKKQLGDKIKKFEMDLFGSTYNGNKFTRCMNYSALDNIIYRASKSPSGIHFLGSRAIPIYFKTKPSQNSKIYERLTKNFDVIDFVSDFYSNDEMNSTDNEQQKWQLDDQRYEYCIDSTKIRFQVVNEYEIVKKLLKNRHDIQFGIIVDESLNDGKFVKVKFLSRFEHMKGPEEKLLGYNSSPNDINNKYTINGQIYINHLIKKAILSTNTAGSQDFVDGISENLYVAFAPYKDEKYIEPENHAQFIRNTISLVPFSIFPLAITIIFSISKERNSKMDLHFARMGVNCFDYGFSWFIWTFLLNLVTIFIMILILKGASILIFTEYSTLFIYSLGFTLSFTGHVLFSSIVTRRFAINLLVYIGMGVVEQSLGSFESYLQSPYREFLQLLPFVNFAHFIDNQKVYEVLGITNGTDYLNKKIYNDSVTVQSLSLINFASCLLSLTIYFGIIFCTINGITWKNFPDSLKDYFMMKRQRKKHAEKDFESFNSFNDDKYMANNNDDSIIRIDNLSKSYGKFQVIKNMNLSIPRNKTTILLGQNGCGKSTLINSILGCTPVDKGKISIILKDKKRYGKQKVNYAPQDDPLYSNFNFYEHFLISGFLNSQSLRTIKEKCDKWAEIFGMSDFKYVPIKNYSGGMKRKLVMALTFSVESAVVFLDEPTSSIDPKSRYEIWKIINTLKETGDHSIVICTHTPKEADILGQYFIIMEKGSIKKSGYRKDIMDSENIHQKISIYLNSSFQDENNKKELDDLIKYISSNFRAKIDRTNANIIIIHFQQHLSVENMTEIFKMIEKINCISSTSISEATSKEIFHSIIRSDDEDKPFVTKRDDLKQFNTIGSRCELIFRKYLSQLYKVMVMFLSISEITIFIIVPIVLSSIFVFIIYLAQNDHFNAKEFDYIVQSAPGNLIKDNVNAKFRSFLFIQQSDVATPSKPMAFFNYIKTQNGSNNDNNTIKNVHCIPDFNDILIESPTVQAKCSVLQTQDISLDLQANFPDKLFNEFSDLFALGGLYYNNSSIIGDHLIVFYGAQSRKSSVIMLDQFYNQLLYANDTTKTFDGTLFQSEVFEEDTRAILSIEIYNLTLALSMSVVVFLMPTFLSLVIIREKQSNFKHLLKIQGLPMALYWMAIFNFFIIIFTINVWIIYGIFRSLPGEPLLGNALPLIIYMQNIYLFNSLPTMFLFTICCNSEFTISTGFYLYQVWIGMFLGMLMNILKTINIKNPDYFANKFIKYFPNPSFKYVASVLDIALRSSSKESTWEIHNDFLWDIYQHLLYFGIIFGGLLIYEHFDDIVAFIDQKKKNTSSKTLLVARNIRKIYLKRPCASLCCNLCCIPSILLRKILSSKRRIVANDDISLKVSRNEIHAIVGLNGAGKTTFFDIITNRIKPTSGKVHLNRLPISDPRNMNNIIGYCPQKPAIVQNLTFKQHLYMMFLMKGVPFNQINEAIDQCLKFYFCQQIKDKTPNQMSGGGKKKLSLSIINPPGFQHQIPYILMFDEANSALDMKIQELVNNCINSIVKDDHRSVLFSTHYFDEIEDLPGKVTVLEKGRVFFDGTIVELYAKFQYLSIIKIRFFINAPNEGKDRFIDQLEANLSELQLKHKYTDQVHFSITSNEGKNNSSSKSTMTSKMIKIFESIKELEDKLKKEKTIDRDIVEDISCGPFDLEQSFCDKE